MYDARPPGGPGAPNPPILNLPPLVKWLLLINIGVQILRVILPDQADLYLILNYSFIPVRYTYPEAWIWQALVSPITYQFIHGGWMHLILNMVILMAFGSGIERVMGPNRTLLFYLICGIAGALMHYLIYPESQNPVIGASGSISGLFGGIIWMLRGGTSRAPGRQWQLGAVALVLIVVMSVVGMAGGPGGGTVAWAAHVGGFIAGLVLFRPFILYGRSYR